MRSDGRLRQPPPAASPFTGSYEILLLIALTDLGTQHWVRTVTFRFFSTLIMLTPLFALAWWLGGLGRPDPRLDETGRRRMATERTARVKGD